ncbi:MAG: hypothetical protein GY724_28390, partial [Actinomycetia bacterium]|nr:hypothetical protein [Actinomycetes bacterium]
APELTEDQRKALLSVYRSFLAPVADTPVADTSSDGEASVAEHPAPNPNPVQE